MPLTAMSAPSGSEARLLFECTAGPSALASAASAATMPTRPDRSTLCAVSIRRESPEREIRRVAVIFEIEHARKARRGERGMAPEPVGALRAQQEVDAASHAR